MAAKEQQRKDLVRRFVPYTRSARSQRINSEVVRRDDDDDRPLSVSESFLPEHFTWINWLWMSGAAWQLYELLAGSAAVEDLVVHLSGVWFFTSLSWLASYLRGRGFGILAKCAWGFGALLGMLFIRGPLEVLLSGAAGMLGSTLLQTAAGAVALLPLSIGLPSWARSRGRRRRQLLEARELEGRLEEHENEELRIRELTELVAGAAQKAHPSLTPHAEQACRQLSMLLGRIHQARASLSEKLNRTEITYLRYLGALEKTYESMMENLARIHRLLANLGTIDLDHVEQRLAALQGSSVSSESEQREQQTLLERRELFESLRQELRTRLSDNEIACTKLDQLNAALYNVKGIRSSQSVELTSMLDELETLVSQAKLYE